MAQLSKILSTLMTDIIHAQHEANMYAMKISSSYRNRDITLPIQTPSVVLESVELDLRCAVTGTEDLGVRNELDHDAVLRSVMMYSSKISEILVTEILAYAGDVRAQGRSKEVAAGIQDDASRKRYRDIIDTKLTYFLKYRRWDFISASGEISVDSLVESVMRWVEERLLKSSDFDGVIPFEEKEERLKLLKGRLEKELKARRTKSGNGVRLLRQKSISAIEVEVCSDALAKLPADSVHTLRMKFSPQMLPSDTYSE